MIPLVSFPPIEAPLVGGIWQGNVYIVCWNLLSLVTMENNPLRGLFGVSSPRPKEQRVAPQPTTPTENIYYEIPSGMIEKLLANPCVRDGTLHPYMHLIYVDEVCGLFNVAGMPEDVVKKKVLPLSLKGKALTWYRCWKYALEAIIKCLLLYFLVHDN